MRLTADVRLTRNSCSINGCENSGWGFAASVISLTQHSRASFRGHHIYKQILWPLVGETLTLEGEEGNNHFKFAVSLLKDATVVVVWSQTNMSFCTVGMQLSRDHVISHKFLNSGFGSW